VAARIVWAQRALEDLTQIAAFIAQDSPHFAAVTASRIVGLVEQAAVFPRSGRVVPEYADPRLRELFWRRYRVIYKVEAERVIVIAVIHASQLLPEDLASTF